MAKWGKKNAENQLDAQDGNAIGLTQAFAPIGGGFDDGLDGGFDADEDFTPKRGRHAKVKPADEGYDGNAIGLTQAFAPLDSGAFAQVDDDYFADDVDVADDAGDYDDLDDLDDYDGFDMPEKVGKHGRHAKHAPHALAEDAGESVGLAVISSGDAAGAVDGEGDSGDVSGVSDAFDAPVKGKHGKAKDKHGKGKAKKNDEEIPAYMRKSRRMRRVLTVVIVLLIALLAAGAVFTYQLLQTVADSADQQVHQQEGVNEIEGSEATDASPTVTKKTTAPELTPLMGLTQEQAVEKLQRGAQVTATTAIEEEGNPVKAEVRVALTAEPADSRTGTPTVYLGLDEGGLVIQAGYSASLNSLGYGSLSFADAVKNERIIEKTLTEVGITPDENAVALPADKAEYSTYGEDGKTLVKEYCSFSGSGQADAATYQWSAVLSYDYATANATGNLADTVRLIYVYVNA